MKTPPHGAERYRLKSGSLRSEQRDGNNGAFQIVRGDATLIVIASNGRGWEHVSVSTAKRCPTWEEMCFVKDLFWRKDEAVFQFHPPLPNYVNYHPYCLHMWKPIGTEIELPPAFLVGPSTINS